MNLALTGWNDHTSKVLLFRGKLSGLLWSLVLPAHVTRG